MNYFMFVQADASTASQIKGSSRAEGFKDWFVLQSQSWGSSGFKPVSVSSVDISYDLQLGSMPLLEKHLLGATLNKVIIVGSIIGFGKGPVKIFEMTLENVTISSHTESGQAGEGNIRQTMSLDFKKITIKHNIFGETGSLLTSQTTAFSVP
jgi:type VI protein secretion system component Hcp